MESKYASLGQWHGLQFQDTHPSPEHWRRDIETRHREDAVAWSILVHVESGIPVEMYRAGHGFTNPFTGR